MSKEHLIPYKPGQSGNPNGRPRKYVSLLKEQGYKVSEINDTIQAMMSMDLEELKSVWDNPRATVLEKTIAAAMRKSLEKGSLYSLETVDTTNKTELTGKIQVEVITSGVPLANRETDV